MNRAFSRGVFAATALLSAAAGTASAAAPAPTAGTPELLAKAKEEGTAVWYTSIELQTAEKIAKAFEAAYPGIKVQVERNGCERIQQRMAQERGSNIRAADVVECSDMTALFDWKKQGWLAAFVPADVARSSGRPARPGRVLRDRPAHPVAHRVQHEARQARGGAKELRRPARPEMEEQDRQGASRLQRHDHDGNLRNQPLSRLGLPEEAWPAAGHAGAVGRRPAEEGGAR